MKYFSSGFFSLPKNKIIVNTINMYYNQQNLEQFTEGRLSVLAFEFFKKFPHNHKGRKIMFAFTFYY